MQLSATIRVFYPVANLSPETFSGDFFILMKKGALILLRLGMNCGIIFIVMKKDELGRYISGRRKSLRVSQHELADLCGISEHALCNLERGAGNPTFDLIAAVIDALGLEIELHPKNLEG